MKNQLRVNDGYNKDIRNANEKAKKLNGNTFQGQRMSEETNNQILALKAKHEAEKFNFERKIKDLQDKLKERDDNDMDKTKSRGMQQVSVEQTAGAGEFSNPVAYLKNRKQKWINNNKEKKNLMDMYIRNVHVIEDAFAQIKQQTGISSTEEIVTTFIKAEEQNYSLYNYVNMLNSEIDIIEEQNKNIEAEIRRHEELGDMTEKEKEVVRHKLQMNIAESDEQMSQVDNQIKLCEDQMTQIKDYVWNMVEHFKKSHFFLSVAQNNVYDDDTQFNENNVTNFLAELEEYISLFITYMAYRQENPDAAISSLSLEKMTVKEFDKKQLHIEAWNSQELDKMNDDIETEDEITTDPRQLYRRFEDWWHKDGEARLADGAHAQGGGGRKY